MSEPTVGEIAKVAEDLKATKSPEEIALSIMAEMVCVRRKGFEQARALRAAVGVDP